MDRKLCPECGHVIDPDTIHESVDSFDDNAPGATILLGECFNEDCDAIGEVSLGYVD